VYVKDRIRTPLVGSFGSIEAPAWLRAFLEPISALIGFTFGVFPWLSVGLMVAFGVTTLFTRPRREMFDLMLEFGLVLLTFQRVFVSWRSSGQIWYGIFEGLIMWFLFRGARAGRFIEKKRFMRAAWIGLLVMVGLTVSSAVQSFVAPRPWYGPSEVQVLQKFDSVRVAPTKDREAFAVRYLDIQGPGYVEYAIELRSERAINIRVALNHSGRVGQAMSSRCALGTEWRSCLITMQLPDPGDLQFVIGGEGTWTSTGPWIEARNGKFSGGQGLLSLQWRTLPRIAGFTLNPNFLGAWLAVLAVLLLESRDGWIRWTAIPFGLVGVVLTGSRGALLAVLMGMIIFVLFRQRSRWLAASLILVLFAVAVQGALPIRSLQVVERNADRVVIYQEALEAIRSAPLFGVGDLSSWFARNRSLTALVGQTEPIAHAHNFVLQVLAESGLVGFAVWMTWWLLIAGRILRSRASLGFAVFGTILLLNTFDMFFLFAPIHIALWIAIVAHPHSVLEFQ
jgi:O-Antigen ligase